MGETAATDSTYRARAIPTLPGSGQTRIFPRSAGLARNFAIFSKNSLFHTYLRFKNVLSMKTTILDFIRTVIICKNKHIRRYLIVIAVLSEELNMNLYIQFGEILDSRLTRCCQQKCLYFEGRLIILYYT